MKLSKIIQAHLSNLPQNSLAGIYFVVGGFFFQDIAGEIAQMCPVADILVRTLYSLTVTPSYHL